MWVPLVHRVLLGMTPGGFVHQVTTTSTRQELHVVPVLPVCWAEQKGSFTVTQLVFGPACRNKVGTGLRDSCCLGRLCCASTALMPVQRFG